MTSHLQSNSVSETRPGGRRRGIAGIWLVMSLPLFIAVLGLVLNVGFLWLAQAELDNAVSAGALAGAEVLNGGHHHHKGKGKKHKQKSSGSHHASQADILRAVKQFVAANRIHGRQLTFDDGRGTRKKRCRLTVQIGRFKNGAFRPSRNPHHPSGGNKHRDHNAVFVTLACQVEGPFGWLCGTQTVHVTAVAIVGEDGTPRLVEVQRVLREQ